MQTAVLERGNSGHADQWRGALICATVLVTAVAYSFRFTSFLHVKDMALFGGACAVGAMALFRRRLPWTGSAAFVPLWTLVACALVFRVVLFPAAVPWDTITSAARSALLLLFAGLSYDLLTQAIWRERVSDALAGTAVLVAALGLIQYANLCPFLFPVFEGYAQRVYSVFGNQDLYGGYLALGAPLLIHRFLTGSRTRWIVSAGLAVLVPGLLVSGCRSAWLAAAVGVVVVLPFRGVNRRRVGVLAAVVIVLSVVTIRVAPAPTTRRITGSLRDDDEGVWARLWFWDGAVRMWRDAPVLGVGLGNYAYWSPRYLGEALQTTNGTRRLSCEIRADHPHSEPLQALAESGALGLLCWLWLFARLWRTRGAQWGGLAALIVFSLFNGPLQCAAHALAGLLLAAALLAGKHGARAERRAPAFLAPAAVVVVGGFLVWAVVVASYRVQAAEDAHLAGEPCLHLYERAVDHPWPNASGRMEYAIALAEAGFDTQAYREFERALKGLDTGDLYLALGLLAARRGDNEAALQWARGCLYRWPSNPDARQLIEALERPDSHYR